jgi:hypothetical protein
MVNSALNLLLLGLTAVAHARTGTLGKSTYAMSHPFAWKAFMESYFPTAENIVQANSTATCVEWVKLCIDDGDMTSCNGPAGNIQLHSVGAYRRDSGSYTMEQLETQFTASMGGMKKYDPWMEQSVGLFTTDLDYYLNAFKKGNVPYFPSSFTVASTGKTYYTAVVQVPGSLAAGAGSMHLIELISNSSSMLSSQTDLYLHPVPKSSPQSLAAAESRASAAPRQLSSEGKPVLQLLKVSFASTNITRDADFFETVLQGTRMSQTSAAGVKVYSGKLVSTDTTEVVFVQATIDTQGPMTVQQWEQYNAALHTKCIGSGPNGDHTYNGFDRLADNHFGHSMPSGIDKVVAATKKSGAPYRFYGGGKQGGSLFYVYIPNGWGGQFSGSCSNCPSGGGYDMCTQGITGSCATDIVSDDDEASNTRALRGSDRA